MYPSYSDMRTAPSAMGKRAREESSLPYDRQDSGESDDSDGFGKVTESQDLLAPSGPSVKSVSEYGIDDVTGRKVKRCKLCGCYETDPNPIKVGHYRDAWGNVMPWASGKPGNVVGRYDSACVRTSPLP